MRLVQNRACKMVAADHLDGEFRILFRRDAILDDQQGGVRLPGQGSCLGRCQYRGQVRDNDVVVRTCLQVQGELFHLSRIQRPV